MTTIQHARPTWYSHEDDTAWERVKAAFSRDWQQTKHDFGGHEPDLNQQVSDTISQASGSESIPPTNVPNPPNNNRPITRQIADMDDDVYTEDDDLGYRYGYAAYRHYGNRCDWNYDTESKLQRDWGNDAEWGHYREDVRRGWFFAKNENSTCGNC